MNITAHADADCARTFICQSGGAPLDLTGSRLRMCARMRVEDAAPALELTTENGGLAITDGAHGIFSLLITADQLAQLNFAVSYQQSLICIAPTGLKWPIWSGQLTVEPGASRGVMAAVAPAPAPPLLWTVVGHASGFGAAAASGAAIGLARSTGSAPAAGAANAVTSILSRGAAAGAGTATAVGGTVRVATGAAAGTGAAAAAGSGGVVGGFTGIYAPNNVAGWQSWGAYRGSYRQVAVLSGASQGKIRITVELWCDPANGHFSDYTHVSFGKWAGANADCTTTPVELTFSGGHGLTGPRSGAQLQTIVSDAVTHSAFTLSAGDSIVVIYDTPTADATAYFGGLSWGEPSTTFWWFNNSPLETWNIAAPGVQSGGSSTQDVGLALVETTASGPSTVVGVGAASGAGAARGAGPPATLTGVGAAAGHGAAAGYNAISTLLWSDEFTSFDMASASNPLGAWRPNNWWQDWNSGYQDFAGSNWNINPNDPNFAAYNPYSVSGSVLTIREIRTPSVLVPYIQAIMTGQGNSNPVPAWCGGQLQLNKDYRTFKQPCYVEYRARWPIQGKGMFPALWMYCTDGSAEPQGKGAAEIDMLEINSVDPGPSGDWFNTNVHQRNTDSTGYDSGGYGPAFLDTHNWHTYGIDRQPDHLDFYYDNTLLYHISGADAAWFNDVKMAVMLNFAMDAYWFYGNGWQSDGTTPSPMTMEVDYVRVYSNKPF